MSLEKYISFVAKNPGKVIGTIAGLLVGILIFSIGFWKTFVVLLLAFIGYIVGRVLDDGRPLADQINDLLNRK
jgi:uncharacterized membrane protein